MQQAIRDYTIFQLEQPFKLIHQLEKMVKKTPNTQRHWVPFTILNFIVGKLWVRPLFSIAFLSQICYTHLRWKAHKNKVLQGFSADSRR